MNNLEKYKVKALKHSEAKWESAFLVPAKMSALGVAATRNLEKTGKVFATEKEANNCTLNYLTNELKISNLDIE